MTRRGWIGSLVLLLTVVSVAGGLAVWKYLSMRAASAASANPPEPPQSVTVVTAKRRDHKETVTSIGTVVALRSISVRNELAGTVRHVAFTSGQIVEAGSVLVALDTSVEEAELRAQEAQAALADTLLARMEQAGQRRAASAMEVDRARAERAVAVAQVARTKAIIARKVIRAPFRARVGIADVHPGQYLNEGTQLTTLQGIDEAVHVDFTVAQAVATGLRIGHLVDVFASDTARRPARIVAIDSRVDPATRNATVRARIDAAADPPTPGGSVRVQVPVGQARAAVAIPSSALRKGAGGDHVFLVAPGADGKPRAQIRRVETGALLGDEVLIYAGLAAGDKVAASGSFKLRDGALVAPAE